MGRSVELTAQQRAGFAQFVFLMLCAHLEELLYSLIKHRYEAIGHFGEGSASPLKIKYGIKTLGTIATRIDDALVTEISSDSQVAALSLSKLIKRRINRIQSQPISELIKSYNEIFPVMFNEVVGSNVRLDVDAIRDMRNIFSHGRAIKLNFFGDLGGTAKPDFDSFTLKPAIESLQRARIITDLTQYNGNNHDKITELIFSDESLLHFYDVTQKAAGLLRQSAECPLEIHMVNMMTAQLPILKK